MIPLIANRYAIDEKIGSGGMGDVFRGIDRRSDMPIAIKILKSELATEDMVARFVREGEALRQLNHPNIVTLLDAVQENQKHYLIMELVEGGGLDDLLRQTPQLPLKQVLNITLDLTDALTRAHRLNIIHRDIKPANILLAKDGMPRLTDFGIARVADSNITQSGIIMGTAAYIAPEVIQGNPADARSDIWALGVMLFEMLAGEQPFKAQNPGSLIYSILSDSVPDLEHLCPEAPAALIDLINRMLMKDPAERIPRMRLVGAELETILSNESTGLLQNTSESNQFDGERMSGSRFATPAPTPGNDNTRNNLPVQTTPFVGRENELTELDKLMSDGRIRLVTILATGGMGKTRLALELAAQYVRHANGSTLFENGVYFVDLAPLTSAENMVQTTAEAVGYAFQQDGRGAHEQLLDFLHEKIMLLIMDNFEHVIAGRELVQDILQAAPGVKFLVTSREKLNLSAENVFVLSGMEFPKWETPEDALEYSAVKLFMQSARRVRSDFQLETGDLPYVARICRMVQGSPLGILLAASWMEVLSPHEIAQEISRSLDFLETEMHDLPERHRSLRAAFEYSWNLLADSERAAFAQISVFRGGFTREAVQQIIGANLRTLTVMVNKSLLRRDNVSGRYEIHELLRQFAEDKLHDMSQTQPIYAAHSAYYTGLLARLAPHLKAHRQLEALTEIEVDFENIRSAWNWASRQGDADRIQQALEAMYLFLTMRNRFMDGEQLFREARAVWKADGENPPLLAGQVLVRYPDGEPLEQFRQGLAIAERHKDAFEIAFCQRLIGHWLSHTEFNQDEGIPILEASLRGFRALNNQFCAAQVLDDLGWSYNLLLERGKQLAYVMESLDLRRAIGDKIGTANSLRNMGGSSGGFFTLDDTSINYWQEAKNIAYEMNDRLGVAWNAGLQAANLIFKGEFDRAMTLVDEAYPHALDINEPVVKGFIQALRGSIIAIRDEDYEKARTLIEGSYPPGSNPDFRLTMVPFGLALVACGLDDFQVFRPYMYLIHHPRSFYQSRFYAPTFLMCRVVMLADEGHYARSVELMRAFLDSSISYIGLPFPMGWTQRWGVMNRLRRKLEDLLGVEAFQAAWERGSNLSPDEMQAEVELFLQAQS